MQHLENTLILITGASTGIGKHLVLNLLTEIDQLSYQNKPIVIGLARRSIQSIPNKNFVSKVCDVSKAEEIEKTFNEIDEEFPDKKISVVVANAGMARAVPLLPEPESTQNTNILTKKCEQDQSFSNAANAFSQMLNVNVLGLTLTIRAAIKKMDHNFPGYIINTNSMSGHRVSPNVGIHFYTATKHAVSAITEGVRQELRLLKSKIRVGQISPGFINTEFFEAMDVKNEEYYQHIEKVVPSALECQDITDAFMLMIKSHPRCQYHDVVVRPTAQEF